MPKFIIDQALLLRTIVEVEADNYEDFVEKYNDAHYQDIINERQMDWNVEDIDEQLFDGGHEEYKGTLLDATDIEITRHLGLDRWKEEYKRELIKSKLRE
jgi:hypothetical protein